MAEENGWHELVGRLAFRGAVLTLTAIVFLFSALAGYFIDKDPVLFVVFVVSAILLAVFTGYLSEIEQDRRLARLIREHERQRHDGGEQW